MRKLIVSDLDGTLLPYGQDAISKETLALLDEALKRGITLAVSSGRTVEELSALLPEWKKEVWLIGCDGAHYAKDGRDYYEKKISHEDLTFFQKQAGEDFSFVLHAAHKNFSVGKIPAEAAEFHAVPISGVDAVREKIFKVTSFGKRLRLPPYCGLRMHWDGGENGVAQYVNRFADKGTALSDLQTRLMLTKFDTVCIGDSGNDVAMMHNAKHAVCIGHRSDALAAACDLHFERIEDALQALLCRADCAL
ncbi:MAG: HAD-IIB family hydrolase [Clostridia bacterium]|nr:HAD-IIB family hydrolase [Clostridia bacterium]